MYKKIPTHHHPCLCSLSPNISFFPTSRLRLVLELLRYAVKPRISVFNWRKKAHLWDYHMGRCRQSELNISVEFFPEFQWLLVTIATTLETIWQRNVSIVSQLSLRTPVHTATLHCFTTPWSDVRLDLS